MAAKKTYKDRSSIKFDTKQLIGVPAVKPNEDDPTISDPTKYIPLIEKGEPGGVAETGEDNVILEKHLPDLTKAVWSEAVTPTIDVHGLKKGATQAKGVGLEETLRKILEEYVAPFFTEWVVTGFPTSSELESGTPVSFSAFTVSWQKDSKANTPTNLKFKGVSNALISFPDVLVGTSFAGSLVPSELAILTVPSGSITKVFTWSLEANYVEDNITKTITISKSITAKFNRISLVDDGIVDMNNSVAHSGVAVLDSNKSGSVTLVVPTGKFGHVLQPKRWGLVKFYQGGIPVAMNSPVEFNYTLPSGATEVYYDYRLTYSGQGEITLTIV